MSSLQQKRSPPSSDRAWKVRNNNLAIEEIMRDRKAAIESGKLKGRRLFESLESATEIGLDGLGQESEVRSVISYVSDDDEYEDKGGEERLLTLVFSHSSPCSSLSSSSKCGGELNKGEELMTKGGNVMTGTEDRNGKQRRWIVVIDWLLIGLIVYAVGMISMKIVNGCQDHKEVSLVPT